MKVFDVAFVAWPYAVTCNTSDLLLLLLLFSFASSFALTNTLKHTHT